MLSAVLLSLNLLAKYPILNLHQHRDVTQSQLPPGQGLFIETACSSHASFFSSKCTVNHIFAIAEYHTRLVYTMRSTLLSLLCTTLLLSPSDCFPGPRRRLRRPIKHSYAGSIYAETCSDGNIRTRVDFNSMTQNERKGYVDAVQCLLRTPSQLDPTTYPAATSRYMDYAVIHVNKTQYVHLDAFFLTWHRYFLFLYESDLRQTCNYTGAFPYWDFAATASDPHSFPIFDGSDSSLSGDGLFVDSGPIVLSSEISLPHGTGGGCVTTGPFANLIAPLKFIDPLYLTNANNTLPDDAFAYNPICLQRDLNAYVSQTYTNTAQLSAAAHADNATHFDLLINGVIGSGSLGIHSGAHFSVGGQMNSIHVSAQDPVWYPLHTMIDKVYWSWQTNYPDRASQLDGDTGTALNNPPSDIVTLDSILPDWGYFHSGQVRVRDLISTTAGPLCYRYDNIVS